MSYLVNFTTSASKTIEKFDPALRKRLSAKIANLAVNPRPRGCKQLREFDTDRFWRIRIGDWRVIYKIDDEARRILVVAVKHRREAYR